MAKIKNINASYKNYSPKGLLKHWETLSDKKANYCSEKRCIDKDLLGVHVQKIADDKNWFIVPLCKRHSKSKVDLDIEGCTVFILANKLDSVQSQPSNKMQSLRL